MFESNLQQYGMAGIFIAYLIYDRQVLLKKLTQSINNLSTAIIEMKGGKRK
jgi:hypothetical protein